MSLLVSMSLSISGCMVLLHAKRPGEIPANQITAMHLITWTFGLLLVWIGGVVAVMGVKP